MFDQLLNRGAVSSDMPKLPGKTQLEKKHIQYYTLGRVVTRVTPLAQDEWLLWNVKDLGYIYFRYWFFIHFFTLKKKTYHIRLTVGILIFCFQFT